MEFIIVTLKESLGNGVTFKNRRIEENYVLPINAIKSVHKKITGKEYFIDICDNFKPDGRGFEIGEITARLPSSFIQILNEPKSSSQLRKL